MRYRQIHLDFHTSGQIPDIGSQFDPKAFGAAFYDAHADSVTVFSKCHHGYSFHPTGIGEMHPNLDFDLLRAQIDALHAVNIKTPIYLSATWDELAATNHPEWRTISPDGGSPREGTNPNGAGWAFLDYSTPYLDYLCRQTEEVMQRYPDGDGIFIDIALQLPSVSVSAQRGMDALGMDWTCPQDQRKFTEHSMENFFERVTDSVRKHDPKMPLFFNAGHVRKGRRKHYTNYYSHLELESLPTAGWGYDHFPLSARYIDTVGIPFLGMTGKFHFHWGEVGGYKKPEALIYECGAMLAHGARCSIGDHLHPTGKIDDSTMNIIGPAFKWVADREPWAEDSVNRAQIGLLSAEAIDPLDFTGLPNDAKNLFEGPDSGASRVLLEGQFAFDVLDCESDFTLYKLLILPDVIRVDAALQSKIEDFTRAGGQVLLTGKSGIDPETGFGFDVGATWHGTSDDTQGDYVLPVPELRAENLNDPLFMYQPSEQITVSDGTSLGEIYAPYFDRTPRHFSGHVNAPSKPDASGFAAGVRKGNFTYLAHPIFTSYFTAGSVAMLEIAEQTIRLALKDAPLVKVNLPRAGRVTVRHQSAQNRDVVHLLFATPVQRGNLEGKAIQPIQDLVSLHDVIVDLHVTSQVAKVRLVPEDEALPFTTTEDRIAFTVPQVRGHQMIEVSYV
ncbi:alpha-amylase family protein [Pacificibacter marinus]|uniref:alpha-amylase family protein n=1 Tax=Pacificibacter marinus TaxID=658057 RepID=UPI001C06D377|nr:alpha-amylase family protein [Pacificibacter marinus]MBU2866568.1 beta-galactosidase trimerization domain-containing protein [Pacificibacter marinus]